MMTENWNKVEIVLLNSIRDMMSLSSLSAEWKFIPLIHHSDSQGHFASVSMLLISEVIPPSSAKALQFYWFAKYPSTKLNLCPSAFSSKQLNLI